MKTLVIFGNSGLGSEVKRTAQLLGYENIKFFDDDETRSEFCSFSEFLEYAKPKQHVIVAIASVAARNEVYTRLQVADCCPVNIIHPAVEIHGSTILGQGNYIAFGSLISNNTIIGNYNIINSAVLGHHAKIGNCNILGPFAFLGGNSQVGDMNRFDLRSSILQDKKIENENQVLPLTVICKNYKSNNKLMGFPSKKI